MSGYRIQGAVTAAVCAFLFHGPVSGQSVPSRDSGSAPSVSPTQGARLGWEVRSGIGYTDNLFVVSSPKQDETTALAGFSLQGRNAGRRLKTQIDLDATYYEYLQGLADSEVVGDGQGEIIFGIVPDRFEWNLGDDFSQSRLSQFLAATPANREYVNNIFTGPRFAIRLVEGLDLTGAGEFRKTQYEKSPYDSDRYFGAAGLRHRISSHRALFALASSEKFEFDKLTFGEDFKRDEYFIRYEALAARGGFVADVGYTSLGGLGSGDSNNAGTLFRLSADRAISRRSSVAISVGREFSTSGDLFAPRGNAVSGADLAAEQAFSAATPFEQSFVSAAWSLTQPRTWVNATVRFAKEEYSGAALSGVPNRNTLVWLLAADRRVSPVASLAVELGGNKDDYETFAADTSEVRLTARAMRSLSEALGLSLEISYLDRSDGNGNANELRGMLMLSYGRGINNRFLRRIGMPGLGSAGDIDLR